uniref:Ribosomal protein S27 like n=1 Tax=Canis lupus dingo TaxID=286419 RepID=A0A8C0K914_CANLU
PGLTAVISATVSTRAGGGRAGARGPGDFQAASRPGHTGQEPPARAQRPRKLAPARPPPPAPREPPRTPPRPSAPPRRAPRAAARPPLRPAASIPEVDAARPLACRWLGCRRRDRDWLRLRKGRHACCYKITTVFSHAQTVVLCVGCSTVLCQPTGGKARLTEGCSFRRKQH